MSENAPSITIREMGGERERGERGESIRKSIDTFREDKCKVYFRQNIYNHLPYKHACGEFSII